MKIDETPDLDGFCTDNYEWCAIPYAKGQYIIIHQGQQVRLCRTFQTAQKFIQTKNK